jgi:hypothetical protein
MESFFLPACLPVIFSLPAFLSVAFFLLPLLIFISVPLSPVL